MRVVLLSLVLSIVTTVFSQTKISGYAPGYLGQTIEVHEIVDFLTMTSRPIAQTTVAADSTFSIEIPADHIQRVKLFAGNNYFYQYVEPNADYTIFIRDRSAYNEIRPTGDEVEFFFLGIDSTDINFKIIDFDAILMRFIQNHYDRQSAGTSQFVQDFERFKELLMEEYQTDTCAYFKTYVKFAVASIDNMAFVGSRNRYEKFDFYLKNEPLHYANDRYMEYIMNYFEKYHQLAGDRASRRFKQAVGLGSPSAVMQALSSDYALGNYRLREFVMLKMLADVYHLPDYSQQKVITILDSLGRKSLYPENQQIAVNLRRRLTRLSPGSRLPNIEVKIDEQIKRRADFYGKHVYVQIIQASSDKSVQDLQLIRPLIQKYGSVVHFLTIVVMEEPENLSTGDFSDLHGIDWEVSYITKDHPILDQLNSVTYPHYLLVDAQGYVVAAPALSPRPNNEYETIERSLFQIKKIRDREDER
jgi:hypothetical protein